MIIQEKKPSKKKNCPCTGSWTVAIQNFIRKHGLKEGIKARKLLQILESENIYGAKYFKEAIKD
jgi:hypothetical protein